MRERPILFSGPMVRRILDGSKTQTRRVVTPSTSEPGSLPDGGWAALDFTDAYPDNGDSKRNPFCAIDRCQYLKIAAPAEGTRHRIYARYEPGDRLWVREAFAACRHAQQHPRCIEYRADGGDGTRRWWPSIHMPRWASRITLEITEVRVERLQAITEADARAEGTPVALHVTAGVHEGWAHRYGFLLLWNAINGKRPGCAWKDNPWVWAITFKRVET